MFQLIRKCLVDSQVESRYSEAKTLLPFHLKGQVTFLKLCLLVVCLALIIPRLTLFDKTPFSGLCQRSLFLPA